MFDLTKIYSWKNTSKTRFIVMFITCCRLTKIGSLFHSSTTCIWTNDQFIETKLHFKDNLYHSQKNVVHCLCHVPTHWVWLLQGQLSTFKTWKTLEIFKICHGATLLNGRLKQIVNSFFFLHIVTFCNLNNNTIPSFSWCNSSNLTWKLVG